jgi:DNA adenine methylase
MKLHPFVKWVGGKTQLLDEIVPYIPDDTVMYVEPFVGGGAVLLDAVIKVPSIEYVIINDKNLNLINAYFAVIYYCNDLMAELASISHKFVFADNQEAFYYEQRDKFNAGTTELEEANKKNLALGTPDFISQAARFMFLNKTCFNGLYRVNRNGVFNASYNKATTVSFDYDNIQAVSYELRKKIILILDGDFTEVKDFIEKAVSDEKKVFVYLDPPYREVKKGGGELAYAQGGFGPDEQERLKKFCDFLTEKKVKFIQSNSDTEDGYFKELYKDYNIKIVKAARKINPDGMKRGKINEILISNFDIQ